MSVCQYYFYNIGVLYKMSIRTVSNYNFEYIVDITLDKSDNIYVLDYLVTDASHVLSYNIYI